MERRFIVAGALALGALAAASALFAAGRIPGTWRLRELARRTDADSRLARRSERIAAFTRERDRVPPGAVVFLGSSTVERFPLERSFPRAITANRGIGDEPVGELIARLGASLPAAPPAAVVLYAGAVDLRRLGRDPRAIASDVAAALDEIARLTPDAAVCLLGIVPERGPSPVARARRAELDRLLRALASERGAAFVETARAPLADAAGGLAERFSSDALHLNDEGYGVLSGWILAVGGATERALDGED